MSRGVRKKTVARQALPAESSDARVQFLHRWQSLCEWVPRADVSASGDMPEISDFVDSLLELRANPCMSVARIGDGELGLATGTSVPNNGCQDADDSLKEALKRVLRCDNDKCRIALPKAFFYRDETYVSQEIDNFVRDAFLPGLKAGDYLKYVVPGYRYMDASMTVVRKHYPDVPGRVCRDYYSLVLDMFRDQDIILVTGDSRGFTSDKALLRDAGAKSVSLLRVPQKQAWPYYGRVKQYLMDVNESGSRLVCLACGPMATVLAYELAGTMRCLDIGHMFSDYNLAMGGSPDGSFWA